MYQASYGSPEFLGATPTPKGVNFAIFARRVLSVTLVLCDPITKKKTSFPLDAEQNRTGDIWHIHLETLSAGTRYYYQIVRLGGLEYKALDPFGKYVDSLQANVFYPEDDFDWQDVTRPNIAFKDLIIYEMHVRAFTMDPSSQCTAPGTFAAVIEKIPYLQKLGVNAIELLPVFDFDEKEYQGTNPVTGERLCNFWGYSPLSYFFPCPRYAQSTEPLAVVREFKTMVRELHRHGIEVILDVVYNHTGEKLKSKNFHHLAVLAPMAYYIHNHEHEILDFSGCGNTLNTNHAATMRLVIESLRYWVSEMHVDGFRFDLASIFCRGLEGEVLAVPPILLNIEQDGGLANTKLIAEPWDAVGLYQVGSFPCPRFAEWNGQYRDILRRFLRGSRGQVGAFARSLCGSENLYSSRGAPFYSINFITAHDGFTLHDLVSYNQKHNLENGEENRDGANNNDSWNCGEEGPTQNADIVNLRDRQKKNFLLALFLSVGTPMLLMGDEVSFSRGGNNNPWCQDNGKNYLPFGKNEDFFRYVQALITLRKNYPHFFARTHFLTTQDIIWHGLTPHHADWSDDSHFIAYQLIDHEKRSDLYIAFNAKNSPALITLPENATWQILLDTSSEETSKKANEQNSFTLKPFSAIVAIASDSALMGK